jgi:tRNA uridine 5-carboxymethylaminomethyl modification enzyme
MLRFNMMKYDVIVVGAGHAGIEAAMVAAKMGASVLLFVIKMESIGRMSCNPSVGGPAKGHLAREIDALGGVIGEAADITGIHFRMLNMKKGQAVWAPRSQNDRNEYSLFMREKIEKQANLSIIESTIDVLLIKDNAVLGVRSALGEDYFAPKVILANGTFLQGKVHVGATSFSAGRAGEPASDKLSESLLHYGFNLQRFKTGTPPRIDLNSANFSKLEEQKGDENPQGFSFFRDIQLRNQVSCYLTYTTPKTHDIIRTHLQYSSLYGGYISGIGPRYCPSIEDKIVKFSNKDRHQVFIEPEGIRTKEAYVNGVSNSLPPHVQTDLVHSITGLENAIIMRYAYAIEYDYIVPEEITSTLETKKVKGLYFAGQINGTSGYEEAAAQGIAAGINAVLSLDKKAPIIFDRTQSYLGVLIDDLVTKGTNEPYRLFTSRAEHRLFLRQDNADERMMPLGYKLGIVSETRWQKFCAEQKIFEREMEILKNQNSYHESLKQPTRFQQILKRPDIQFDDLAHFGYNISPDVSEKVKSKLSLEIKYEGYLNRQMDQIQKIKKMEHLHLPESINYMDIHTIAFEAREKLQKIKPASLGQASRIPGVNQNDLNSLMVHLRKTNAK